MDEVSSLSSTESITRASSRMERRKGKELTLGEMVIPIEAVFIKILGVGWASMNGKRAVIIEGSGKVTV